MTPLPQSLRSCILRLCATPKEYLNELVIIHGRHLEKKYIFGSLYYSLSTTPNISKIQLLLCNTINSKLIVNL